MAAFLKFAYRPTSASNESDTFDNPLALAHAPDGAFATFRRAANGSVTTNIREDWGLARVPEPVTRLTLDAAPNLPTSAA